MKLFPQKWRALSTEKLPPQIERRFVPPGEPTAGRIKQRASTCLQLSEKHEGGPRVATIFTGAAREAVPAYYNEGGQGIGR